MDELQLGHVLSNMVSLIPPARILLYVMASIGPCPFKHGKDVLLGLQSDAVELQLGHVLSNMVRLFYVFRSFFQDIASIGPCPFKHGKMMAVWSSLRSSTRFNWAMSFQTW